MRVRVDTSAAGGGRRWRVQRRQPQNVVYDGPSRSVLYTSTFWSAEAPLVDYTLMMSRTQKIFFSRCWHRSLLKRPKYDDYAETRLQLAQRMEHRCSNKYYLLRIHARCASSSWMLSIQPKPVPVPCQPEWHEHWTRESLCISCSECTSNRGCSIRTPRALKDWE